MAEAGRSTRTIGAALDGVGLGPDGSVWGGELLACSAEGFERLGTLEALPLPGGDRAARECWRMGAALLLSIDREDLIEPLLSGPEVSPWMLAALPRLAASPNTPRTSALGRWFDAAAALLGICRIQKDEATAAMRLESAAAPILRHVPETQILAGFDPTWTIKEGVLSLAPFWKSFAAFLVHPEGRTKRRQAQAAAAFELVLSRALSTGLMPQRSMTPTAPTLCSRAGAFSTEHWLQPFRPDSKRSALLRICRMSCRPETADSRSVRLGSRPSLWRRAEPSILTFKIKLCSITQETPAAAKVQLPRQLRPASDAAEIELFSFKRISSCVSQFLLSSPPYRPTA